LLLIAQKGETTMMLPRNFKTDRANGQSSSTGPTSAAGKHIVSQNSLKHGLTGRVHAALPGEKDAFAEYLHSIRQDLDPVGALEGDLADAIAGDRWRLRRAQNMENALFNQIEREQTGELDPATAHAQAWIDASKGLQRIAGYARSLQRNVERNTAALETLQAKRKAIHEQAKQEAILLTQLAEANGETYNPGPDFPSTGAPGEFVYSAPEIARLIARASRLADAKILFAAAA
jgi:hypothetical protein